MATPIQMQTSNTLNPTETYGSTGNQFNVEDNSISEKSIVMLNQEQNDYTLSWVNNNIHNQAKSESVRNPNNDYVDPSSNDRFSKDFVSVTNPNKLQKNITNNINTMVGYATSERGLLEFDTPNGKQSIEGISLQTLKQNQDLYPRFQVSSRPDPRTGFKTFTPYVFDKETNTPLNKEEFAYFVQNIAAPAIGNGVVEYAQ